MRKLVLTTAILAGMISVAQAQDAAAPGMFRAAPDPMQLRASDFIGMRIYAAETAGDATEYAGVQQGWDDIGEVNDVILSRDGKVDSVLVDIGGFLGMGEKPVAVNLTDIDILRNDAGDDLRVYLTKTKEQLEALPAYAG